MLNISVVLVTYNRLTLLKKCLDALNKSTYNIKHVIIIDNNSTDGTSEYLEKIKSKKNIVQELNKNIGGAGGFYVGIKTFQEKTNDDLVWVMDDDTIPEKEALENFVKASNRIGEFGFLAGNVRWIDQTPAIMNVPAVHNVGWNRTAESKDDVLYPVLISASFVSLLISRTAISAVGYPIKEFFIWGDDVEYTERISARFSSYFVSQSIAIHETTRNIGTNLIEETGDRVSRYFYDIRNKIYRGRKKPIKGHVRMDVGIAETLFQLMVRPGVKQRIRKIHVVLKGIVFSWFFHPKMEQVKKSSNGQV